MPKKYFLKIIFSHSVAHLDRETTLNKCGSIPAYSAVKLISRMKNKQVSYGDAEKVIRCS